MEKITIFAIIVLVSLAVPTWASRRGNIINDNKMEILEEAMKLVEREELKVLQEAAREVAMEEQQPLKNNLKACANPGDNCAFIPCCDISGHDIDCLGNRCYDWSARPYPPL